MPFGSGNTPTAFQRCMLAIFADMIETYIEVFVDDFLLFQESFENCLTNLGGVPRRFEQINLVLNWGKITSWPTREQCWGTKYLRYALKWIELTLKLFERLESPISVTSVRSFIGHEKFCRTRRILQEVH